jgi:acylphosphatase
VQGVFFRDSTRQHALRAGVEGWVRNLKGGVVEAVFEGPPDAVASLVEFCRQGPEWARVERIEVFEEPPEQVSGFQIR